MLQGFIIFFESRGFAPRSWTRNRINVFPVTRRSSALNRPQDLFTKVDQFLIAHVLASGAIIRFTRLGPAPPLRPAN